MPVASYQYTSISRSTTGRSLTRATLRPEVPQDDDGLLALLDRPTLDSLDERGFFVEHTSFAREFQTLLASDLGHCAAWCEVSFEDPEYHARVSADETRATGYGTLYGRSPSEGCPMVE